MLWSKNVKFLSKLGKKNSRYFRNPLYLKAAPRFFYKGGKSNLAFKLLRRVYLAFFWNLFRASFVNSKSKLSFPSLWLTFHSRLQQTASFIKFVPHFIRRRTKKVPFGATPLIMQKQIFRTLASLVRRSRQSSDKALLVELQHVFKRSSASKLILFRDAQHKKAESLKPLVRRARLPYIPNFFSRFYANQPKFVLKRMRRDRVFKSEMRTLASRRLKIARIEAFYRRKQSPFYIRKVDAKIQRFRYNLFFNPNWRLKFKKIVLNLADNEI